ncbi:ribbon-helix-helix domain-containing protein [Thalassotalea ponticola]|uniref:ribbon-helix-helix domain-containing protein n=1 Tax=Thalassotalea ponticola TaxID=1523392 RepID=UPI0025B30779|nr:ribbon-helix-helix domain-containing protein [Thalassotalea ponticola]MDN3652612.1 ribbon-helix-helix domain-containing protein [Thalassotalea ponticola]
MSLADLKKKSHTKVERTFTVDDFIDDSVNYAMGKPQIVSADLQAQSMQLKRLGEELKQSLSAQIDTDKDNQDCNFRHATFTLSEDIIEQLNELSKRTNIAKSRILRILVSEFFYQDNPVSLQLSKIK